MSRQIALGPKSDGDVAVDHPAPPGPAGPGRISDVPATENDHHQCTDEQQDAVIRITDPADERIADYRALTDVELRTRWEPPHGLFIAEGELVLRRALRAGYRPRSFLVDAKRIDQLADLHTTGAPIYTADQDLLEQVTGFHVHRGVLASFHRGRPRDAEQLLATARRLIVQIGRAHV